MQKIHQSIGILGGTFDPIHHGHLRVALELQEAMSLNQVHIIPCYQPVHRSLPKASPKHRLAMIQMAIQEEPSLIANSIEIDRAIPSYTIDTLLTYKDQYPDTSICLLIGIDAFLDFTNWHRWQDILNHAHLVVAHRPSYQLPQQGSIVNLLAERLQSNLTYLHQHIAGGIFLKKITPLEISATEIRNLIENNKNPRFLLPNSVYNYIKQHKIYNPRTKDT